VLVGERRILDGIEHAEQQICERDLLAKWSRELRDAQREAATHAIEALLIERERFHESPPKALR